MNDITSTIEGLIILTIAALLWVLYINRRKIRKKAYRKIKETVYPQNHYCFYRKKKYITKTEMNYAYAIQKAIPKSYRLYPQVCLASIIEKQSDNPYQNELYRIIDFGIFDNDYNIRALIEINDSTHHQPDRIERDKKIKEICGMANIPLITLWTEYGINEEYIAKRIKEYI